MKYTLKSDRNAVMKLRIRHAFAELRSRGVLALTSYVDRSESHLDGFSMMFDRRMEWVKKIFGGGLTDRDRYSIRFGEAPYGAAFTKTGMIDADVPFAVYTLSWKSSSPSNFSPYPVNTRRNDRVRALVNAVLRKHGLNAAVLGTFGTRRVVINGLIEDAVVPMAVGL